MAGILVLPWLVITVLYLFFGIRTVIRVSQGKPAFRYRNWDAMLSHHGSKRKNINRKKR